jgi:hypothetical protein
VKIAKVRQVHPRWLVSILFREKCHLWRRLHFLIAECEYKIKVKSLMYCLQTLKLVFCQKNLFFPITQTINIVLNLKWNLSDRFLSSLHQLNQNMTRALIQRSITNLINKRWRFNYKDRLLNNPNSQKNYFTKAVWKKS